MDDQRQEYRDIQGWLKGKKPPAQGRTWRRAVHQMAEQVVPETLRNTAGDVVGLGCMLGIPVALICGAGALADLLQGGLAPAGSINAGMPIEAMARLGAQVLRSTLPVLGVAMLVAMLVAMGARVYVRRRQ